MKKYLARILLIAGLCLSAFTVSSQVLNTNVPVTPQQFYQTALDYFTSFNTNSVTWLTDRGSVQVGASYVSGVNVASTLGFTYNIVGASTNGNGFELRGQFDNAAIAGNILGASAGVGYHVSLYDARLSGYLKGGYDWNAKAGVISPGLELRKAMTARTYSFLSMEIPVYLRRGYNSNLIPRVGLGVGFTF